MIEPSSGLGPVSARISEPVSTHAEELQETTGPGGPAPAWHRAGARQWQPQLVLQNWHWRKTLCLEAGSAVALFDLIPQQVLAGFIPHQRELVRMTVCFPHANRKPPAGRFLFPGRSVAGSPDTWSMYDCPLGDPELALLLPPDKTERIMIPVETPISSVCVCVCKVAKSPGPWEVHSL